jgi:hypothetical protein
MTQSFNRLESGSCKRNSYLIQLTASGVGTLIALESQSQVIQSHVISLLTQMLAAGNERETRSVVSRGGSFKAFSTNLSQKDSQFSELVLKTRKSR